MFIRARHNISHFHFTPFKKLQWVLKFDVLSPILPRYKVQGTRYQQTARVFVEDMYAVLGL